MPIDKIERSAFLYMEPSKKSYGDPGQYAQCGTCTLYTGEQHKRCYILGKSLEVLPIDTCALYVNGIPTTELAGKEEEFVTEEEAGFEKRQVRCANCFYFNPILSRCKLFFILDTEFPDEFNLGSSVHRNGCCNANIPKNPKKKDPIWGLLNKFYSLRKMFSL